MLRFLRISLIAANLAVLVWWAGILLSLALVGVVAAFSKSPVFMENWRDHEHDPPRLRPLFTCTFAGLVFASLVLSFAFWNGFPVAGCVVVLFSQIAGALACWLDSRLFSAGRY